MLKVDSNIVSQPLKVLLAMMKALAVIPVALGVLRSELLYMKQAHDEAFRAFASRIRGKVDTCNFSTNNVCSCGISSKVDYTDHMMRDILIVGIYNTEIRCDILRVEGITEKSINEVTSLVEKHEMARNAHMVSGSTSAISERQKVSFSSSNSHKSIPPPGLQEPCAANRDHKSPCQQ